jgi:hypothetical protein
LPARWWGILSRAPSSMVPSAVAGLTSPNAIDLGKPVWE